jgi:hypothetical protein
MRFALLSFALLAANALFAQAPPANALTVLNEYLTQAAADIPAYRADIRAAGGAEDLPPGRLLGFSSILGPFTYRPRRYGELSAPERQALLASAEFRAFLVSRRSADASASSPGAKSSPLEISLSPEEMLRLGPSFFDASPNR